jgi:hypothetical protein
MIAIFILVWLAALVTLMSAVNTIVWKRLPVAVASATALAVIAGAMAAVVLNTALMHGAYL